MSRWPANRPGTCNEEGLPVTVGGSTCGRCLGICLLLLRCLNQLALGLIDVLEQPIRRVPDPLLHLHPSSLLSEVGDSVTPLLQVENGHNIRDRRQHALAQCWIHVRHGYT